MVTITDNAISKLNQYQWPGNLRELRNVASFALTVSGGASVIDESHLPEHLLEKDTGLTVAESDSSLEEELKLWIGKRLDGLEEDSLPPYRDISNELEKLLIESLLNRFDGKLARLATALQANRTTLRKRLRGE